MLKKLRVGILGATGTVGQRFVQLLAEHPWFEVTALAASERSTGRTYREAVRWKLESPIPEDIGKMSVLEPKPNLDCQIIFSALDSSVAGPIEEEFARAGYAVFSNAKNHRMDEDVPILIPEVNPEHLKLIELQRAQRRWKGFIVTNGNCSTITLCMALAPLERDFGIERVLATTMQAVSGAGYPGVPSLDILGNLIPNIDGEEEKIERETKKIFGALCDKKIEPHPMTVSATTTRVAVLDGHSESVSVKLRRAASLSEIKESFRGYSSLPQELKLPTAPVHPIVLREEADRPQPRLDAHAEKGMATVVGRVRNCSVLDYKFVVLGHNTLRGAAGAAVLDAELLVAQGFWK
ncbi:aspartate-semialdehyde dehydrogenase [Candidatus Acetothermia bacterium]|jgi:aspartate-semialdehyde dehydrogenase|nr:aspartate-semialdehyde dehydrogenase [Candidatus Acetothermia bacterium]MCI2431086.1 aspartate-semialdehyde dehydrogenase [Candidatus Acetothermia bacterium]MCI2435710.1 aspartate-semialdehyde dehydrogenase [Candidatus Acetothermia bacterium]